MKKDDLKKELTKLVNDKKTLNVVVIALILAFVLLAISFLSETRKKHDTKESLSTNISSEDNTNLTKTEEVMSDYEKKETEELKILLKKIDSVGEVDAKIYFESGEIRVPATEETTQEAVTEETDNQGGKRTNKTQSGGSTVVMAVDGNSNEPYILKVNKPEISGVLIVAEGARSSKVKYDIQVAVSTLYGISIDKVNVYPMTN